jgi:hypothetical protein
MGWSLSVNGETYDEMCCAVCGEPYHITDEAPVPVAPAPGGSSHRRADSRDSSYLIK